jgi:hypothetical protein
MHEVTVTLKGLCGSGSKVLIDGQEIMASNIIIIGEVGKLPVVRLDVPASLIRFHGASAQALIQVLSPEPQQMEASRPDPVELHEVQSEEPWTGPEEPTAPEVTQ